MWIKMHPKIVVGNKITSIGKEEQEQEQEQEQQCIIIDNEKVYYLL